MWSLPDYCLWGNEWSICFLFLHEISEIDHLHTIIQQIRLFLFIYRRTCWYDFGFNVHRCKLYEYGLLTRTGPKNLPLRWGHNQWLCNLQPFFLLFVHILQDRKNFWNWKALQRNAAGRLVQLRGIKTAWRAAAARKDPLSWTSNRNPIGRSSTGRLAYA